MTHVGKDPPSGNVTEQSAARQGGFAPATWDGLIVPADPQAAARVLPTPFGLIRIWEAEGCAFIAETSSDGTVLGPPLALSGEPARAASAAVHRVDADFFLTVTWLSGSKAGDGADILVKTWQLGRGAQGLSLTAANDNPTVVGTGASEALIAGLPGDALLLSWVDAASGHVHGQVRTPQDGGVSQSFVMGQTTLDPVGGARRVQVIEIAPLEYAVLWLASNRRDLSGVSLTRDVALMDEGNGTWTSRPLPPVALDLEVSGGFAINADRAGGILEVRYEAADGEGVISSVRQTITLRADERAAAGLAHDLPADDFGFIWASQDLLHLAPSALHAPGMPQPKSGPLVTRGDEPLLIDLAAHGAGQGVKVVAVDGMPLADDGPTRIANGWLQHRLDGHLTFTPDVDAKGHFRMFLSGVADSGAAWNRHLDVHVEGLFDAAELELRHPVKVIPAQAIIAHHAQMAEIGIRGEAPPHGAVTLSGADADKFVVIGNGLFLRAGTRLEPGRKALDVAVQFKDGIAGAAIAASLTIAVLNEPGALLSLAMPGRAQAAEVSAGQLVAEVGVADHSLEGDRISLALLSNAGGRFALAGGNLVVASPQLFAHDPEASYEVVVRMAQPNGVAVDHKIMLHHDDVLGRLPPPPPPEKLRAAEPAPAPSEPSNEPVADASAAIPLAAEPASFEGGDVPVNAAELPHEAMGPQVLPPLHVGAHAGAVKGSSSQPDLGTGSASGRPAEADGLSKVIAQQQRESDSRDHDARDNRGSDSMSGRLDRFDRHEKDLVEAFRSLGRSGDDRGDRGWDHKSDLQKAQAAVSGDTLFFKPGFGKETIEHVKLSGGEAHDVLDLSLYGTTFEALRSAGAFEQVGNDVVLTLNPADPAHSDQIILKSIDLHQIDPGDFKFS